MRKYFHLWEEIFSLALDAYVDGGEKLLRASFSRLTAVLSAKSETSAAFGAHGSIPY
jgi:hypothetical protein